jgi:uroporphyrin-3 C-methyltransferase
MSEEKRKQSSGKKSVMAPGAGSGTAPGKDPGAKGAGGGSKPPAAAPPAASGGGGSGLALLALVVAAVAVALAGYLWYQGEQQRKEAAGDSRLQTAVNQAELNAKQVADLDQKLAAIGAQLGTVEDRLSQDLAAQAEAQQETAKGAQAGLSLLDQEVEERLGKQTKAQQAVLDATANEVSMLRNELAASREELNAQFAADIQKVRDQIETIQLAQRGLNRSLEVVKETVASGGDKNAWTLSEVDYLLQIADHRLRFQDDALGATAALVLARTQLKSVDEMAFAPVQAMIDEEIAALKGVQLLDRSALVEQIGELAKTAGELPIRNEARTQALRAKAKAERDAMGVEVDTGQEDWWEDAATSAWGEIKKLVVVRHERRTSAPLIAPEEEYFLAQNLRLRLEVARLAVMMDDGAVYQDSLAMARRWIENYFDTAEDRVIAALDEIKQLQQVQLQPYLPDISRSLKTFRDVMTERKPLKTLPEPGSESDQGEQPAAAEDSA